MSTAFISLLVILGLIVGLLFAVITIYNGLIKLRTRSEAAWSDISVQLKRRHNLIPNLVKTVKAYAGHEKDTLESVIKARNHAVEAPDKPGAMGMAEAGFAAALGRLFALAEDYPDLKADSSFLKLQDELSELEEVIQMARRFHNGCVRDYNEKLQTIPENIIAAMFNFEKHAYFELPEGDPAHQVQEVDFS
ncbi:MAG: LemA family protein [Alphaproteobacteria bacterium]